MIFINILPVIIIMIDNNEKYDYDYLITFNELKLETYSSMKKDQQ